MAKPSARESTPERVYVDEITLDGRKVAVRSAEIAIDRLHLDPKNPRIANTIALRLGAKDQFEDAIQELLWSDPEVHELYRQVLVNRGLIERIIVKPDDTVVEGNCRLVVYRKLHENQPRDDRWLRIPSRVLPDDITEREVALLLAQLHVQGKNKWSPFEKAGHVFRLHRDFVLTQEEIAVRLRMSKSKVNQMIRAFETMQHVYLKHYDDPASVHKYSYFEELFKKPELREWATSSSQNVERFAKWVGDGKIALGMHVRDLPAILENEAALSAFERGGHAEARKILEKDDPTLSSVLFKKMAEAADALRDARLDDINRARPDGSRAARRIVSDLHDALKRFMDLAGIDEADDGEDADESANSRRRPQRHRRSS
jgi:hypothetical protein